MTAPAPVPTGAVTAPALVPTGSAPAAAPPAGDRAADRVFVAPARTRVDTTELTGAAACLEAAAERLLLALGHADDLRHHLTLWFPAGAGAAVAVLEDLAADVGTLRADVTALADHLLRAARLYEEAEAQVAAPFRPSLLRHLRYTLPRVRVAGVDVPLSPEVLAGLAAVGATAAVQPHDSRAALTQRAVRAAAEDLQHAFPYYTGRPVTVDGISIDPGRLTPAQRVALGLVPAARLLAAGRGAGPPVTTPVPPAWAPAPTGLSDAGLLRRTDAVGDLARRRGVGMVEVLRTTAPSGRRTWTVLVPGTQDLLVGGRSPLDNLSNLEAMAGIPTDVEVGVASALRHAGVARGEPVTLVGHSQGALVAARLAADPLFTTRYDVRTVLTAGGPLGGITLPPDVTVLSLEDVEDPVVGLDGLANAATGRHLTVVVDTRGLDGVGHPHDLGSYAVAAELVSQVDDPALEGWRGARTPPDGASTEAMRFEIAR